MIEDHFFFRELFIVNPEDAASLNWGFDANMTGGSGLGSTVNVAEEFAGCVDAGITRAARRTVGWTCRTAASAQ